MGAILTALDTLYTFFALLGFFWTAGKIADTLLDCIAKATCWLIWPIVLLIMASVDALPPLKDKD
jgi:hypothetical protein